MGQQGGWLRIWQAYNPLSLVVGQLWFLTAVWATRDLSQNNIAIEEENQEIAA